MSALSEIVIESFRLQPSEESTSIEIYSSLLKSLAQEIPSPDMYSALLERIEREDESERDGARRRAHERAWELAKKQGVKPIRSIKDLRGDFWPEEESVDDFLKWLRATRQEDKARDIPE